MGILEILFGNGGSEKNSKAHPTHRSPRKRDLTSKEEQEYQENIDKWEKDFWKYNSDHDPSCDSRDQ